MYRWGRFLIPVFAVLAGWLLGASSAFAAPVRYWGQDAELTIGQVSDYTVRINLATLDAKGKPRTGAVSTAMTDYPHEVKLRTKDLKGGETIAVGKLKVAIKLNPFTITVRDAADKIVQELVINETDGAVDFRNGGPILGLGEGDRQFDRSGGQYPAYNAKGNIINGQVGGNSPYGLATHGGTIRDPFIIGTEGWAMFIHRPFGEFDLRGGKGRFVPGAKLKTTEPLELFIINVTEPPVAMKEYARLTGQAVMPPKWAIGYMQSHRSLELGEPVKIAKTFRDKQLPCDTVIYLGTGYTNGATGWNLGHGTFEFNPKVFDKPADYVKALHDMNFKIVLHINNAPTNMQGTSVNEKSMVANHISNYWAKHKKLMDMGVDGWWPDDGDQLLHEARLARHRCYYEGPLLDRPNVRPWAFHRNGYVGVQRYGGWIWSGDTQSRWATLAAHVPVGINTSISLTPFWGSDTGGFVATSELTGELYARWFQFSTFNTQMRSHGRTWKARLPWGWGLADISPIETGKNNPIPQSALQDAAIEPICKKYLELRYALLAYNYTLMREIHDTGMPPMRAMWLHYPNDAQAVKLGDQYMWGRDILVAPVVEKGAKSKSVYLPAGDWYDWWTNEKVAGKQTIKRAVDLATMPLYVHAGAIIPLDPVRQYTSQPLTEPTTLRIYRGADGQFVLYDDDGKTLDYLKGQGTWAKMTWNDAQRQLVIEPDARGGMQVQGERVFNVVTYPDMTAKRVSYGGKRVEVKF